MSDPGADRRCPYDACILTMQAGASRGPRDEALAALEEVRKELEDTKLQLEHTQRRLGALLRAIPSGIIVCDATSGLIVDVNRVALAMLDAPTEDIVGTVCERYVEARVEQAEGHDPLGLPREAHEIVLVGPRGARVHVLRRTVPFESDGELRVLHCLTDISGQKRAEEALRQASLIDQLTELPNRRGFEIKLVEEWNRALRTQRNLAILMCDVDHFKAYNDAYGHLQGDWCLQQVARALRDTLRRASDFPARWGGEEFAVILADIYPEDALACAERVRRRIEELAMARSPEDATAVTVSVGLAVDVPIQRQLPESLLDKADRALYRAKLEGRNRVSAKE